MNTREELIKDSMREKRKECIPSLVLCILAIILYFVLFINENGIFSNWEEKYILWLFYGVTLLMIPIVVKGTVNLAILFTIYSGTYLIRGNQEIETIDYAFEGYDSLVANVNDWCANNGYIYSRFLQTPVEDEQFTIFTKIDTTKTEEFPNNKVAIYHCSEYLAERIQSSKGRKIINYAGVETKEFVKMFSDYNLRKYRNNSEMVEVDTIIIVVVNKMNYVLREILEGTYKEKYVLFAVVCSEYPNQLLISKDNRWVTGEDYIQKRNELLEILKVRQY